MKKALLTLLVLSNCYHQFAQLPYNKHPKFIQANKNWIFTTKSGLDLNTHPPTTFDTENSGPLSTISVASDPNTGQLLFYMNDHKVWNANHQVMPNGTGLLGNEGINSTLQGLSLQGVQIVPFPEDSTKYYIFTKTSLFHIQPTDHPNYSSTDSFAVFYSVVDMNLNNGLGDIVSSQKNIPLTPEGRRYTPALLTIPGECNDIWLLLHRHDSAVYEAWHIDENGISSSPVISNTGFPHNPIYNDYGNPIVAGGHKSLLLSAMHCSPDRKKIIFTGGGFLLGAHAHSAIATFDPETGMVSNEINIGVNQYIPDPTLSQIIYASAFSPDNTKLYTFEPRDSSGTIVYGYYQYNLSDLVKDSIDNSKQFIAYPQSKVSGTGPYETLRLYNDTIYVGELLQQSQPSKSLGVITNPNAPGTLCNYMPSHIPLGDSTEITNLPTEVIYPFKNGEEIPFLALDTLLCAEAASGLTLQATYGSNDFTYQWSTGATGESIQINTPGTYWVNYTNGCYTVIDTFRLTEAAIATPVISEDNDTLSTSTYITYQWLKDGVAISGATDSFYHPTENGDYQVVVTNEAGCTDTSDVYTIDNGSNSINRINQLKEQIRIYPNPATHWVNIIAPISLSVKLISADGRILGEYRDVRHIDISNLPDGLYILKIKDKQGQYITTKKLIKKGE